MTHVAVRSPSNRAGRKRRQRGDVCRQIWRVPLRRARRAIASAVGRIETSGRVIDATLRFGAHRAMERAWQLYRLSQEIDGAERALHRALRGIEETYRQLGLAPEMVPDSPRLLTEAALRFAATATALDQLGQRAAQLSVQVVEETEAWAASVAAAPAPAAPAAPAQPTRAAAPRQPRILLAVIIRRSPVVFATPADAARKTCRGRAPPSSHSARSHHCS